MKTIGVAIIAFNEALNIDRVLKSVSFAEQIVVVDSGSTDDTVKIAKQNGAEVIFREWTGYSQQKQFALEQLTTDWVIPLDADEWLTKEYQSEIVATINQPTTFDAYRIKGRNLFMGRELTTGKGLDNSLRLFKRGKGRYDGRIIHESLIVDGTVGELRSYLIHNSTPQIRERLEKIIIHGDLEMNYAAQSIITVRKLVFDPIRYFLSYYFKHKTWRDGIPGLIWLVIFTFQIFILHARYFEFQMRSRKET